MERYTEFQQYLEFLCKGLGHADRSAGFIDYCKGLMLPIERKSIEPLAAHSDPYNVQAKHQSLHHFIAKSDWSDQSVLSLILQWAMPTFGNENNYYWIVDDSGIPKIAERIHRCPCCAHVKKYLRHSRAKRFFKFYCYFFF